MAEVQRFYVDNFMLTVNKACYLVEVEPFYERAPSASRLSDLPQWVFESEHAIWLSDENANIAERARKGEMIRKELQHLLH